jgi:hypothetical protein
MKRFLDFIKEEVDLRGSKGIPSDFMSKAEQEARASLGIRPDDESQMRTIWPEFERKMQESNQILTTGPNGERLSQTQINERVKKLEELAEKVVRDRFDEVLNSGIKPIELNIKLVPMGQVSREIRDITNVPQEAKQPTKKQQEDQDKKDEENRKKEQEEQEEQENTPQQNQREDVEELPGTNLVSAIDKKKILNMITQAAGKSTKDVIRASDIVDEGLQEIFGDSSRRILDCWVRMSDLADRMDWVIPIDRKSQMMKNMPGGMAGACEVKWESHSGNFYDMKLLLEKEATKIVIHSTGVDFPMLIHETIKGIYLFLQSGAIKKDKETAKIIKAATSSFSDEAQDFRYGPPAYQMLLNFINKFEASNQYKRLDTRVFTILAIDKERAMAEAKSAKSEFKEYLEKKASIAKTDDQFLEIMKSMFSVFDLQGSEYVVNEERFNTSLAKREIKKIIDYIVDDIESYKSELEDWEREQREREEDAKYRQEYNEPEEDGKEDEIDSLIKKSLQGDEKEETGEVDYSQLSQKELQELIDDALDDGDYKKVQMLAQYMKEGKEVYLKEVERINESHNFHTRRK